MNRLLSRIAIGVILVYRYTLSGLFPGCCRFEPSCSAYGLAAIRRFGVVKGGGFVLKRLARCHPWGGAGIDPVPDLSPKNPAKHGPAR